MKFVTIAISALCQLVSGTDEAESPNIFNQNIVTYLPDTDPKVKIQYLDMYESPKNSEERVC